MYIPTTYTKINFGCNKDLSVKIIMKILQVNMGKF